MTRTFEALLDRAMRAAIAAGAIPDVDPPACVIEEPSHPVYGDGTTRVAMDLARRTGRPALGLAEAVVAHVTDPEGFLDRVEAAGPGFVNVRASLAFWRQALAAARPTTGPEVPPGAVVLAVPEPGGASRVAFQAALVERLVRAAGSRAIVRAGEPEALADFADAAEVSRAIVVHAEGRPGVARRAKTAFGTAGGERGRVTSIAVAPLRVRRRGVALDDAAAAAVAASPAGRFALAGIPADAPADLDAERLGVERMDDPYFAVRYALARIGRSGTRAEGDPPALAEAHRECARGVGLHGDVVRRAARRLAPDEVVRHGRGLAAAFHRHYNRCASPSGGGAVGDPADRAMAAAVAGVLEDVLALALASGS